MAKAKRPMTPRRRAAAKKARTKAELAAITDIPAEESGRPDNAMGRPEVLLSDEDWAEMDQLAGLRCTTVELAAWFSLSVDSLERKIKERHNMTFADYLTEKAAIGKASLRRVQMANAMGGNATMQIWLGKQLLDQKDKQEMSTPAGEPFQVEHSGQVEHKTRVELVTVRIPRNGYEPGGEAYDADVEDPEGSTLTGTVPVEVTVTAREVPDHLRKRKKKPAAE
jgi:hypothetical protein